MIDGIKTGYLPLDVEKLSSLLGVELNRQTIYTNQNGLIFGFIQEVDKSTGEMRYMCGIRGSVHTFKNHGTHNADQFRLSDLNKVYNDLKDTYNIRPEITPIFSVEFGVNLHLPYCPKCIINAIKAYKGKSFIPMGELGLEYNSSLYTLKIYDKGRKYKEYEHDNILRIEIRAKCSYLRRKGLFIKLMNDLLSVTLWEQFERMILEAIDNTVIVEAIPVDKLKPKEKELIELFTNDNWQSLDRKALYRKKKQFNKLLESLNTSTMKDELKAMISHECRILRDEINENGDKINVFSSFNSNELKNIVYKNAINNTSNSNAKNAFFQDIKKAQKGDKINIKIKADFVTKSTFEKAHPPDSITSLPEHTENIQHTRIRGKPNETNRNLIHKVTHMKTEKKGIYLYSAINLNAANRLRRVRIDWGFKSSYEIIRYIIYCFIRVADIENASLDEDLPPEEIERIFNDLHSNNRDFSFVKAQRQGLCYKERKCLKSTRIKIKANVTAQQMERLERVKETYGFASIYEILQYAIACFIRALDTSNTVVEPEPEEIKDLFNDFSDSENNFEYIKPKRAPNESRQKQSLYS